MRTSYMTLLLLGLVLITTSCASIGKKPSDEQPAQRLSLPEAAMMQRPEQCKKTLQRLFEKPPQEMLTLCPYRTN